MEIRRIQEADIDALIAFGESVYPQRRACYHTIVEFFQKGRIQGYTGGLVLTEDGNICGQILATSATMWYKGQSYRSGWLYDFIVREDLRKDVWGVDLLMEGRKEFKDACSVGANQEALSMNLKLGSKMLGELRKYVGLTSLLMTPFYLMSRSSKSFPDKVAGFSLIQSSRDVKSRDYYNSDLLESGRNQDFISWRFFTKGYKEYSFYQHANGDYFVVRPIKYKGVRLLAVVDFRCDLSTVEHFREIFKAVKSIARALSIPFILCGSSHQAVDEVMEQAHCKSIGRPRPITTAGKYKDALDTEKIQRREFTLITLADSDGEVSW